MEWISVKDELPAMDAPVLFFAASKCRVHVGWRERAYWMPDGGLPYAENEVTHWAHLPEPPTGVSQ